MNGILSSLCALCAFLVQLKFGIKEDRPRLLPLTQDANRVRQNYWVLFRKLREERSRGGWVKVSGEFKLWKERATIAAPMLEASSGYPGGRKSWIGAQ
jgi:hypothetical protein